MRDHRRIFLQVVGWQPVVFIAHQRFKEAPGTARDDACGANIFGGELARILDPAATNVESD